VTKEEILKSEILKKNKSVRAFCMKLGIPYSTLATALDRGIDGMAYGTVIKMCDDLMLSPIDFAELNKRSTARNATIYQHQLQKKILKLNKKGIEKIIDIVDDLTQIPRYTE